MEGIASDISLFTKWTYADIEISDISVADYIAQDVANTAWAFVTAGQSDMLLLAKLANVAE